MTTPTLPGTIPGLLRPCSPVIVTRGTYVGLRGVVVSIADGLAVVAFDKPSISSLIALGLDDIALDLSDPTGRAHAASWSALRECPASHVLDPAAVAWHPAPAQADAGWALEWQARAVRGSGSLTGSWWTGRSRSPVPDSLLWHLIRDDPRLLPDGSRWVDAEALRLVCLHVAGASGV